MIDGEFIGIDDLPTARFSISKKQLFRTVR